MCKKLQKILIMLLIGAVVFVFNNFNFTDIDVPPNFVTGIFIAPELSATASQEEWDESLRNMADIGIDTIIIQYTYQENPLYGNQAYFDYWQYDTTYDFGDNWERRDQVRRILTAARQLDMDVFLGLQLTEKEWFEFEYFRSYDWLYHQFWLSSDLADALMNEFYAEFYDTISGWYLPFEFESSDRFNGLFPMLTEAYFEPITSHLKNHANYRALPIIISPLMFNDDDPAIWVENLKILLSGSYIDILAPQDGIGFGTQTHETVGEWFEASRRAVDTVNRTTGRSISLWGNCENYKRQRDPHESDTNMLMMPKSINKFIRSLDIVAPYVDKLITFSIHRWDTAQSQNKEMGINQSYFDAYKWFYQYGLRSTNLANGYFVSVRPLPGYYLNFHHYARAGMTVNFRHEKVWDNFFGIHSPGLQPFILEIHFDDPEIIQRISVDFHQDEPAGISLPREVRFDYMVRSESDYSELNYFIMGTDASRDTPYSVVTFKTRTEPIPTEGIRLVIYPDNEWTFIGNIWAE